DLHTIIHPPTPLSLLMTPHTPLTLLSLPLFHCFLAIIFFFNDTATTEIYTLSLHDALPICFVTASPDPPADLPVSTGTPGHRARSEEHTSELQSRENLVCRLLLEKKKKTKQQQILGTKQSQIRSNQTLKHTRRHHIQLIRLA